MRIAKPDARGWAAVRRGSRTVGYIRALPQYVRVEKTRGGSAWWVLAALVAAGGAWALVTRGRGGPALPDNPWVDRTLVSPIPPPAYAPPPAAREGAWHGSDAPATPSGAETESERNGREFENWAAVRLGRGPFHLKEWRGDKYVEGVFAESTLAPDLLVEYRDGRERFRFAVECKWRSRYWDDGVRWGEWKHLHRYRGYAQDEQIPVYLLLGVGGSGAEPHRVYLVPLEYVRSPILYLRELRLCDQANGDGAFVFDLPARHLRLYPVGL